MRSYLVVANKTLGGEALVRRLRELIAADQTARYFVLAPVATQPVVPAEIGGAMGGIAMIDAETQGYLEQEARDRVETLVGWLTEQHVEAGGTTVIGDPLAAIERLVRTYEIDEILVSTLPSRVSRWLRVDLVRRIERRVEVPVSTIVATDAIADDGLPEASAAPAAVGTTEAPAAVSPPTRTRRAMGESVYKIIELVGTSTESWEKAAAAAVATASKSLRDLRVAEISEMDLVIDDGEVVAYRAKIKVSFKYNAGDD
jgi:flavin-binding protein dodecin